MNDNRLNDVKARDWRRMDLPYHRAPLLRRCLHVCSAIIALICAASAGAALTTRLVAHYPMDGNALDAGPFANHGVVYEATATADRFGREGRALSFDGFNDYVWIADSGNLNLTGDFTISAWIRTRDTGSIIFSNMLEVSPHDGYSLRLGLSGQLHFMSADQHLLGTHPVNLDSWTHVAVTLSGTTARAYVNGVLDAAGPAGPPTASSVDQTIGASYTPWYFFRGSMDEVRVHDRACPGTRSSGCMPFRSR